MFLIIPFDDVYAFAVFCKYSHCRVIELGIGRDVEEADENLL